MQSLEDRLEYRIDVDKYVTIPEAHDAVAAPPEVVVTLGIVRCLRNVLTTIEFDDKARLQADEIADIRSDRPLPSELEVTELTKAETMPKKPFGVGWVAAKISDEEVHEAKTAWPLGESVKRVQP